MINWTDPISSSPICGSWFSRGDCFEFSAVSITPVPKGAEHRKLTFREWLPIFTPTDERFWSRIAQIYLSNMGPNFTVLRLHWTSDLVPKGKI